MARSRSRSPTTSKRDRRRSRSRSRERRHRKKRSRSRSPRRRPSPQRHRSPSNSPPRRRSPSPRKRSQERDLDKPDKQNHVDGRAEIDESKLEGLDDEQVDMMKLMGFVTFDTTKGKKVDGNDVSAVNLQRKRRYRQYMNRRGGFNRPLDFACLQCTSSSLAHATLVHNPFNYSPIPPHPHKP
ncbi:RNA binding protein yantar [Aplysia californica]|uniref:U4/U6.U5 small nuclear ribonucleoprotein 27 kDa protein n=1 Tax=Aplysia californica TaxID=6500 RepID=Q6JVM8_APLCA|nr:RNA binding protein yantar [Aplysia californica]AAQ67660.1 RNA binding protein yantar [Aplysia californica]